MKRIPALAMAFAAIPVLAGGSAQAEAAARAARVRRHVESATRTPAVPDPGSTRTPPVRDPGSTATPR